MRLAQLRLPFRPALGTAVRPTTSLSNTSLRASSPQSSWQPRLGVVASNAAVQGPRFASVKAQGAYRLKMKKTIPKKMGAKRVGEQYVLPGTIIYKQRGTIWHAGENTILGRDHTIHSAIAGYVKYYRDPARDPRRQYIGVTFERNDKLPYSPQAVRERRVGLTAVPIKQHAARPTFSTSGIPTKVIRRPGVIEAAAEGVDAAAEAETASQVKAKADKEAVEAAEAAAASADGPKRTKAAAAARRWNAYVRVKRTSRVLFLGKNYAYSESNVMIGRLMGMHKGHTPGTRHPGSRHGMLRSRRLKQDEKRRQTVELEKQQKELTQSTKASSKASKKKKEKKVKA